MESQIDKLKQKYWEGSTSIEEEQLLKRSAQNQNPTSIENRFFAELENLKSVKSNNEFSIVNRKTKRQWQFISSAAIIAILITLGVVFHHPTSNNKFVVSDPHKAYEISQQALLLVSSNLNKGKTFTEKLDKINEIKQTINN
jgi:hypothetical protein